MHIIHTQYNVQKIRTFNVEVFLGSRTEFERLVGDSAFLEHAVFSDNMYGTSKAAVAAVAARGRICILDIDVQGVKLIRANSELAPLYVFIRPPGLAALEERLRARATETEASLAKRLAAARAELEYGEQPGNFDLVIVNDDLDTAYSQLREFCLPKINQLLQ